MLVANSSVVRTQSGMPGKAMTGTKVSADRVAIDHDQRRGTSRRAGQRQSK